MPSLLQDDGGLLGSVDDGLLGSVGSWLQRSDQRAQDWMARQRGHLNRIRDFGEQRQMIWPGVAADAGIGLLDLIQGPRTGVMTPEAVMGLLDVGTLGVKPPGALGALAFHGSRQQRGKITTVEGANKPVKKETTAQVKSALAKLGSENSGLSYSPSFAEKMKKAPAKVGERARYSNFMRTQVDGVYVNPLNELYSLGDNGLVKLTAPQASKAQSQALKILADNRYAIRKHANRFSEPAEKLAGQLADNGYDVKLSFPDDSSSRYLFVSNGEREIKVRIADHQQPIGWRENRITGEMEVLPVGGFSQTLRKRHLPSDISVDPSTGVTIENVLPRVQRAF